MLVEKKHEIKLKRKNLLALHQCIMIVLNNDIPDPADAGLLLELMSRIAEQDKVTTDEFTLKLEDKYMRPAWHCCNIVLQNGLQKDHFHATDTFKIFELIAEKIDNKSMMETSPLQLIDGGKQ